MPSYDQVNAAYQRYLGRGASQEEYQTYWANDNNYDRAISQSGEAQDYRAAHPTSSAGPVSSAPGPSGPSYDQVNQAYVNFLGRPASQQEYQTYWAGNPNYSAAIAASGEAAAYKAKLSSQATPPPGASVSPGGVISYAPGTAPTIAPGQNPAMMPGLNFNLPPGSINTGGGGGDGSGGASPMNVVFAGMPLGAPSSDSAKRAATNYLQNQNVDPRRKDWAPGAASALNSMYPQYGGVFKALDGETLGYGDEYIHSAPTGYGLRGGQYDPSAVGEFFWGSTTLNAQNKANGGAGGGGTVAVTDKVGPIPPGAKEDPGYQVGGPPTNTAPPTPQYDLASYFTNSPLMAPWTQQFVYPNWQPPPAFVAPELNEQTDPGYAARLKLGMDQVERTASARGTALTGGTLRDLEQYRQDFASAEYPGVYGRAMTNYQNLYNTTSNDWMTNYNKALQAYNQSYNIFENNQNKQFNRLASIAGYGQTAAGQLGSQGTSMAGIYGNLGQANANAMGNIYGSVGSANAAGSIASGNAWNGALGNVGNTASMYGMWNLFGRNPTTTSSMYDPGQ